MTDRDEEAWPGRRRDAWADLDLLTPDDVCTLLKVEKSWLYETVEPGAIQIEESCAIETIRFATIRPHGSFTRTLGRRARAMTSSSVSGLGG